MEPTGTAPRPPLEPEPVPEPGNEPISETKRSREGAWATPRTHFEVTGADGDRDAASVHGRRISGPQQGFGKMWQKTFRVRLEDASVTPEEAITRWRERYGDFWPEGNEFRSPLAGVAPGEIALISGKAGGLRLSTGVLVLYADETSFSFICPEGHPWAGLITFSADVDDDGTTAAQVQLLIRAHDPIIELGMTFGGHRKEEGIWNAALANLARSFDVLQPKVAATVVCVDRRRQWGKMGNLRHDAALNAVTRPFRRHGPKAPHGG